MATYQFPFLLLALVILAVGVVIGAAMTPAPAAEQPTEDDTTQTIECRQVVEDGADTVLCFLPPGVEIDWNGTANTTTGAVSLGGETALD